MLLSHSGGLSQSKQKTNRAAVPGAQGCDSSLLASPCAVDATLLPTVHTLVYGGVGGRMVSFFLVPDREFSDIDH